MGGREMKDKRKIRVFLTAFKLGHTDIEETIKSILETYSDSKRFNYASFVLGMVIGFVLMYIRILIWG